MIIYFEDYLRRKKPNSTRPSIAAGEKQISSVVIHLNASEPETLNDPKHPFETLPKPYRDSLTTLWPAIHAAIERDRTPWLTENRMGSISSLIIYRVDSWPRQLKSFLWVKYGEGCLSQNDVVHFEHQIDAMARTAVLRSQGVVNAELATKRRD